MFGFGRKTKERIPSAEEIKAEKKAKKDNRKKGVYEQLAEYAKLHGGLPFKPEFDKEAAIKRIFPRQGIGGVKGVRINMGGNAGKKVLVGSDGSVAVGDGDERQSTADEARAAHTAAERSEYFNPLAMFGIDEKVLQYYESRTWIGYPLMSHLATHEIISKMCDIPAKDAIAHGYKIDYASSSEPQLEDEGTEETHEDKQKKFNDAKKLYDLKKMLEENKENNLTAVCRKFAFQNRAFGVAYCIPVFKSGEDFNYENPFNPDGIQRDSFVGMKVIEPMWMSYEFKENDANNPASLSFYEPEWYKVAGGRRIHKSWVVKSVHIPVSDLLKPTYYFGGISIPQMAWERIYCADKCANEAPMLVMTKRLLVADANVQAMLADDSVAKETMKALNYFRDNFSVFFKNPNTQVSQIDTSLEGVPQTSMMQYQLAAAIADMPVTKLLKNVPTGLQSTGDYEMDDYHELCTEIQTHDMLPVMKMAYICASKSKYGEVVELMFKFNPLEVPKRKDMTQEESTVSSVLSTYLTANVITIEEAREALRKREDGMFAFLSKKLPEQLQKRVEADIRQNEQQIQQATPQPQDPNAQAEIDETQRALEEAQRIISGEKDPSEVEENPEGDNPNPEGVPIHAAEQQ